MHDINDEKWHFFREERKLLNNVKVIAANILCKFVPNDKHTSLGKDLVTIKYVLDPCFEGIKVSCKADVQRLQDFLGTGAGGNIAIFNIGVKIIKRIESAPIFRKLAIIKILCERRLETLHCFLDRFNERVFTRVCKAVFCQNFTD